MFTCWTPALVDGTVGGEATREGIGTDAYSWSAGTFSFMHDALGYFCLIIFISFLCIPRAKKRMNIIKIITYIRVYLKKSSLFSLLP